MPAIAGCRWDVAEKHKDAGNAPARIGVTFCRSNDAAVSDMGAQRYDVASEKRRKVARDLCR
jgi:hypothetical protein